MKPDISTNPRFRRILKELGLELNDEFCDLATALVRECATIAKKNQDFNDWSSHVKVNIDQCILCDFDLPE